MRIAKSIVTALLLGLGACGDDVTSPPDIETTSFASSLGVNLAASTKTASGLYIRDITVGSGAVVTNGQVVSVRYSGALANGTVFDGNYTSGPAFTFTLGARQVIAGWDEGVAGMRVGGRRQLVIPPALGYGSQGTGPIPGNAILVFSVDVISAS